MWFAQHRILSFVLVCLALCLIGASNTVWMGSSAQRAFLITLALNTLIVGIIGAATNGNAYGVLVDNRNRVSLSKFQAVLWTILVLSSVVTAAAVNIKFGKPNALEFLIPGQLLFAMGISAFSLVATPAILTFKADKPAAPADIQKAVDELGVAVDRFRLVGQLFGRVDAAEAALADMFRGDEVGDASSADLSKVQQFIVTLLLVSVYGAAVFAVFEKAEGVAGLPALSDNFVWLFGISHAGYLANKAVPHSS